MIPLSEEAYKATFTPKMTDVTAVAEAVVDIWAYLDALPKDRDTPGLRDVDYVYRNQTEDHEHVLIATDARNVYLVVVVDIRRPAIHGHYWLDLNREYGLSDPPA
jgi:hypothetical protein